MKNTIARKFVAGFIASLAVTALSAQAQDWAFTDGFEGIAPGSDPDSNTWNYVAFWETQISDPTAIQVLSAPPAADLGTNYLRVKKFDTGPGGGPGFYFLERAWDGNCCDASAVYLGAIPQIQQDFVWQFAFRVADNTDGFRAFIGRRNNPSNTSLQEGIGVGVQGGFLTRFEADGEFSVGAPIATGTWYTVTLDARWNGGVAPQLYDLYLDGVVITNDVPLNHVFANGLQSIHLIADSDGVEFDSFFLDDFNPSANPTVELTEQVIEGTTAVTFPSAVGVDYKLQVSTDLVNTGSWTDLDFTLHGNGNQMKAFDGDTGDPDKNCRLLIMLP